MLTNEEKKEIINNINNSEVEILFVCLGCPKQEYWMAEHKDYLKCTSHRRRCCDRIEYYADAI